jgi:VCBS repeat-containing protein
LTVLSRDAEGHDIVSTLLQSSSAARRLIDARNVLDPAPPETFRDIDTATLGYSATSASGAALPSWLAFDPATQTFSGKPPANYVGTIGLSVTASDGALTSASSFDLDIVPVNDPPVFGNVTPAVGFVEDGAPLRVDTNLSITNPDNTGYDGGALTVALGGSGSFDRIGVAQVGGIALSADEVLHDGVAFGTFVGGDGAGPLTFAFHGSGVKNTQVTPLLRAITFQNTSDSPPTTARDLTFIVRDTEGDTAQATFVVAISAVNDPAQISGLNTGAVVEDGAVWSVGGSVAVNDPDAGEARFRELAAPDLVKTYGSFQFDPDTGEWSYTLANDTAAVQDLASGEQVSDVLTVTSADGSDIETITVNISGEDEAAVGGTSEEVTGLE